MEEGDVARVISKWTGIPISKLVSTEREKLLSIGTHLHRRIIGQADAVDAVATAIQRSRADLSDPNGPIASFMFLGPTGEGGHGCLGGRDATLRLCTCVPVAAPERLAP